MQYSVCSVKYTVPSLKCAVEYTPPPSSRDHPWFAGQHPQVPGDQAGLPGHTAEGSCQVGPGV